MSGVTRLVLGVAMVVSPVGLCASPQDSTTVLAVMYALTYDSKTLAITHAQVVGGYSNVDVCRDAMPKVLAAASSQLESGERLREQRHRFRMRLPEARRPVGQIGHGITGFALRLDVGALRH